MGDYHTSLSTIRQEYEYQMEVLCGLAIQWVLQLTRYQFKYLEQFLLTLAEVIVVPKNKDMVSVM